MRTTVQIQAILKEPKPHPFTPAANPRIKTCVRCGLPPEAPVHS